MIKLFGTSPTAFLIAGLFFNWTATGASKTVRPVKIAAIWTSNTAVEYLCVMNGMIKEMQKIGSPVQLQSFEYNNSLSELATLSEKIAQQGFDAVIGPRTSQEALASAPVFNREGIPQILPVASHSDLTEKFTNTFRIIGSAEAYAKKMAKFISGSLKPKNVIVVTNLSMPYSTYYKSVFSKNMKALGSAAEISYIDIIDGNIDYSKISKDVAEKLPDVIYAPVYDIDITNIYSHLLERNLRSKIVTHAGMFVGVKILKEHLSDKVEIFYNGIWDGKDRGKISSNFNFILKHYCNKTPPNVRTAAAYDAVLLALKIAEVRGTSSADRLYKARKIKVDGVLGEWKSNAKNEVERSLPIYKMKKTDDTLFKVIH